MIRSALFALAFVLLGAAPSGAQVLPGGNLDQRPDTVTNSSPYGDELPGSALEGPLDPETYVLGPGDGLVLEVLGAVTMRIPLEVDPEGDMWIPDYGSMHVAGRTLAQVRDQLKKSLRGGTRGIQQRLRLVRLRRIVVYVQGEVATPGAISVTAVTRLSEAIRRAGGLTARASQRNITILGIENTARPADLLRFGRVGDLAANPLLRSGDRILVPVARLPVFLHAPVPYPGAYEFREGETVKDLVALGGGLLPTALPAKSTLLRFKGAREAESVPIDLAGILGGSAADIALKEGDRLFVPSAGEYHEDRNVSVRGEVGLPGVYPIDEGGTRVSDALLLAGGVTADASPNGILVIRRKASALERDLEFDRLSRLSRGEMTDNEYQTFRTKLAFAQTTFRVGLEAATLGDAGQGGQPHLLARDVALQGGDIILVERRQSSVQVAGEVRLPGLVAFDSLRSAGDYIKLAGGFSDRAKRGGTRITRVSTGQTLLLKDAKRVEPGDLIYVPDKRDTNWFGVLRDIVALAASIATVVVVARR